MPTLLHLTVSPRGNQSISRRLSDAAVEAWKESNPEGRIVQRDLAKTPLTFVDLDWIAGAFSPPEYHTEKHKKALALSNELVSELLEADEIILGTPMYNFSVPAALKAWIDHVVRAGKTFRYTSAGAPKACSPDRKKGVGDYRERRQLPGRFTDGRVQLRNSLPAFHLCLHGRYGCAFHPCRRNGQRYARPNFPRGVCSPFLQEIAVAIGRAEDRVGASRIEEFSQCRFNSQDLLHGFEE